MVVYLAGKIITEALNFENSFEFQNVEIIY